MGHIQEAIDALQVARKAVQRAGEEESMVTPAYQWLKLIGIESHIANSIQELSKGNVPYETKPFTG